MKTALMSLVMLSVFAPSAHAGPCSDYYDRLGDSVFDVFDADTNELIARVTTNDECDADERNFLICDAESRRGKRATGSFDAIGLDDSTAIVRIGFIETSRDRQCGLELVGDGRAISSQSGGRTNVNNIYVLSTYEDRDGNIEINGASRKQAHGIRILQVEE